MADPAAGRPGLTGAVDLWQAPTARGPLDATVSVPGSKSVTNRALVLAALADGTSVLRRPLRSRDTLLMAAALRSFGIGVADAPDPTDLTQPPAWVVRGNPGPLAGDVTIDVGNAGTVARFLPPAATLARGPVTFDGDARMRERPLGPLLTALRVLGADVDDGGRGALPVVVRGRGRLAGGAVEVDASSSSQLVSGLLLSAPRFDAGVTVTHTGARVPSGPHLAMTVAMLRDVGVGVGCEGDGGPGTRWSVPPAPILARDVTIEPDLSSAAVFLAAALVAGGIVTVPDWPAATTQPGGQLPDLLARMGAHCTRDRDGMHVSGGDGIRGIEADLRDVGELTPVLAALAALAESPSYLFGVAHLRGQETDRLAALRTEIVGLGGAVTETDEGLRIEPRPLHGGLFRTYDDHRMAMAGALLGLRVPGVRVENIATTGKTVPDFTVLWGSMLAGSGHDGRDARVAPNLGA